MSCIIINTRYSWFTFVNVSLSGVSYDGKEPKT